MKFLVTGGAGFIGSHVVPLLLREGHQVRVLDNLSTGAMTNLPRPGRDLDLIVGDLRSRETVQKAVRDVDGVFHLGALASVTESLKRPMLFHAINTTGTLNLFQAAAEAGVKRVVFSSSAALYGDSDAAKNVETMPTASKSPYAATKEAGEIYGRIFSESLKLEVVSLRYFNVYGPRQSATSAYASVIPLFIKRAFEGVPLKIFGDGEQTRDFVYVEDVARANWLAMSAKRAPGRVFNIASGRSVSVNTLVENLTELLPHLAFGIRRQESRPGEIQHSGADIRLARRVLGFEPEFQELSKGLEPTVAYYASIFQPSSSQRPAPAPRTSLPPKRRLLPLQTAAL